LIGSVLLVVMDVDQEDIMLLQVFKKMRTLKDSFRY